MIFEASRPGRQSAAEALDQLARRYWSAVYAYLRSSGRDVDEAAELTQGFVCDVMLGRQLFAVADPKRGRFRSLLLRALKTYIKERHRARMRKRLSHQGLPLRLDPAQLEQAEADPGRTPEAAFYARWSATLVRHVLDEVRSACLEDGLEAHWTVFEARVARPLLCGDRPQPYAALVRDLDLSDAAQASNMMITVKRRFARALYAEVGRTVTDPADVEEELGELLRDLERPS